MKLLLATALLCSIPSGCTPAVSGGGASRPEVLRMAVTPGQTEQALRDQYAPFQARLAAELGIEVELVVPSSYGELLRSFEAGEIHLARMGGVVFVLAEARAGAVPVVMRDVDFEFTSTFVVHVGDAGEGIQDFAGRSFSFGSELSTSGHVMPRRFLLEQGIEPETFFGSVHHSPTHDQTVYDVRDKLVDVGVVDSTVFDAMLADGRVDQKHVRALEYTPPYRNYVWAVSPRLSRAFRDGIRDAFLGLRPTEPAEAVLLQAVGAGAFFPATSSDFEQVHAAVRAADLLGEERGE